MAKIGLEPMTQVGQKHGRPACLKRSALLPVSSCSHTACICHRQRRCTTRLTAAARDLATAESQLQI